MVGEDGYRLESRLFGEQGMFGTLDESLDFADGYFLGKAIGTFLQHRHPSVYACIASDSHPLSVPLESEVVRGLLECGVRVLSFSVSPTPLVRFAATELRAQVALSVSRGSLPDTHSGVKVFLEGAALDEEHALRLRNISANGNWRKDSGGRLAKSEGVDAYTMRLFAESAWRQENGARGDENKVRRMLPRVLFAQSAHGSSAEVLGTIAEKLSAHAEQVRVLEDAAALRLALRDEREQVGFLFNSDGTALQAFVGGRGEIQAEELFGLLLPDMPFSSRRPVVLVDGFISRQASKRWQSGHDSSGHNSWKVQVVRCRQFGANLLTAMSQQNDSSASISAAISCDGHMALCDNYYPFEDAFYVALRFLSGLAMGSIRLDALRALSSQGPSRGLSGEISGLLRLPITKAQSNDAQLDDNGGEGFFCNKDTLLTRLRDWVDSQSKAEGSQLGNGDMDEVERELSYGRWIVRAARFEEVLFARCEGKDEEAMERVKEDLRGALSSCGVASVFSAFVLD